MLRRSLPALLAVATLTAFAPKEETAVVVGGKAMRRARRWIAGGDGGDDREEREPYHVSVG